MIWRLGKRRCIGCLPFRLLRVRFFRFRRTYVDSDGFGDPEKAWKIAGVATVGSVLGGYFGYIIGVYFFDLIAKPVLDFYGYLRQFETFQGYYHEWGAWIVFGAGVTPFPYKVITIASGVVGLNIWVFGIASVLARGLRFFLVAWLLKKYGHSMKIFIEKNLGMLSVVFLLLLLGGFALIKFL